jgi:hypothetical protein
LENLSFKNCQQLSRSKKMSELLSKEDGSFVLDEAPEWAA